MKKLPRTVFASNALAGHQADPRRSWGMVGSINGHPAIAAYVWADEMMTLNGTRHVLLDHLHDEALRFGHKERRQHLELMRHGALGFALICKRSKDEEGSSQLIDYIPHLFPMHGLEEFDHKLWGPITDF